MSRRFALILLLALSPGLFSAFAAWADTPAQARKAIQAAYDQQAAGQNRKDVNASFAHVAPEFKNIGKDGKVSTLQQERTAVTHAYARAKSVQVKQTITSLRLSGNKAIVTMKEHAELTAVNPRTSALVTFVDDEVDEDTWVKRSHQWWEIQSKTLKQTQTMR